MMQQHAQSWVILPSIPAGWVRGGKIDRHTRRVEARRGKSNHGLEFELDHRLSDSIDSVTPFLRLERQVHNEKEGSSRECHWIPAKKSKENKLTRRVEKDFFFFFFFGENGVRMLQFLLKRLLPPRNQACYTP